MPFAHAVEDHEALRRIYRDAHPLVSAKIIDRIDGGAASFIARAPFVVFATARAGRVDTSPRGGPAGFVQVLDEHRLAFGDLTGNNLLDSFENLVAEPAVSLIFVIPGLSESLRVAGRATLSTDPELLERTAIDGRLPHVAVGIDVERCFIHCGKAFKRSQLWEPESWPGAEARPSVGQIIIDHTGIQGATAEQVQADLDLDATHNLWQAGGTAGEDAPAP